MVKARRGVPEARRANVEEVERRGGKIEGEKLAQLLGGQGPYL